MRFISTSIHGVLDYLVGMVLILAPWMLQFANEGPATYVPVALGAAVIMYSLFTDYEFGMVGVISMKTHLWLDALSGIFLAASPWLFNFNEYMYWPHVVFGIAEFLVAICTRTTPVSSKIIRTGEVEHGNPSSRTDRPFIKVTRSDIDQDTIHNNKKAS